MVELPVTAMPVLGGVVAGITVTVSNVFPPGETAFGLAEMAANSVVPPPLQGAGVLKAFRGTDGIVLAKSLALLSVSWQPFCCLDWLLFAAGAAVTAPSTNRFVAVPQPTESIIAPVLFCPQTKSQTAAASTHRTLASRRVVLEIWCDGAVIRCRCDQVISARRDYGCRCPHCKRDGDVVRAGGGSIDQPVAVKVDGVGSSIKYLNKLVIKCTGTASACLKLADYDVRRNG